MANVANFGDSTRFAAIPQKQIRNREKNLLNIVAAAEIVFAENGFAGATYAKIAAQAEIPKSNVLYYFPAKEALYRAVIEDIYNVWRFAADSIVVENSPQEALGDYIDTKLELARTRPYGSRVWANEIIQGAPIVQDYLENDLKDWTSKRVAVINAWIAEGRMKPVDPRALLYMIWSVTQHYADFGHQIETINDGQPLSEAQWQETKRAVKAVILHGVIPGQDSIS